LAVLAALSTQTAEIIAIAAAGVALVGLIVGLVLSIRVRRLRRDQRALLGDGERDLVAHAAELQRAFEVLAGEVAASGEQLNARMAAAELALRGAISHSALVRYDAYNEASGRQSMSIALLDDERSGVVLSCIHHRDQARVYGKQIRDGRGELELSPEEAEAVSLALDGAPATDRDRRP
jgi:hypothetical protein